MISSYDLHSSDIDFEKQFDKIFKQTKTKEPTKKEIQMAVEILKQAFEEKKK